MSISSFYLRASASLWLILSLAACATTGAPASHARTVQPGDTAQIRFLCKLENGEIAAATDKLEGEQAALPRSAIFLLRTVNYPVPVTAATALPAQPLGGEWAFEDEIINRLSLSLAGMEEGESRIIRLTAKDLPERPKNDYVLRLARIRELPRETRMTIYDYWYRTGKSPAEGQTVVFDPPLTGRVETVTQDEVLIRFSAQPGASAPTPYGPARVRETKKAYELIIDAREGTLVRTAHLIGRITSVDEKFITIDYRNPFGGEPLICDVKVQKIEAVQPAEKAEQEGSGK